MSIELEPSEIERLGLIMRDMLEGTGLSDDQPNYIGEWAALGDKKWLIVKDAGLEVSEEDAELLIRVLRHPES